MPARRLTMRKVQEVLRLLLVCGLSQRQVSRVCGIARASVGDYLARAQRAGLVGTPLEGWSEEDLDGRLYPSARRLASLERPAVDWAQVHEELKLKNVTLSLVWQEYRERQPDGYQYSRFLLPAEPAVRMRLATDLRRRLKNLRDGTAID
jgi:transposase